ncbi:beta-1,3-glucan-binding protein-like [Epargyreus clarus]|uniref:beta-1,3-glucan-binding protein-like n=1 Tax=Epargyreus clarus TaxID=520877 RepID=UPI003C2ED082
MTAFDVRRTAFALLCSLPVLLTQDYQVPDVTIQALKPRGIRISIPDNPRMTLFVFQGHVNREIDWNDVGTISAEVESPTNGFWTYQDDSVALKVGDVINYNVHVSRNRKGYQRNNLKYTITELVDPDGGASQPSQPSPAPVTTSQPATVATSAPPTGNCRPTATEVKDRNVCSGQVIFEDNFDTLREDLWNIEQYLPLGPDFPFVSYQRPKNGPMVSVENGFLRIEPKLQEQLPGFDNEAIVMDGNKLDLTSGCTRTTSCEHVNQGNQVMPPIASGRVTSNMFAFKYGIVEIRAKLPQGDWLYPDILLESLVPQYGIEKYASGILRVAGALGNSELRKGTENYSNKVLYGGPVMNFKCRTNLLAKKVSTAAWGDDFHVYALRWAPDRITLSVDGEEWGRTEPPASGLQGLLPRDTCDPPRMLLTNPMAPFDVFFRIALGVSAGGISEFPDQVTSQNSVPKPWVNTSNKARAKFISDQESWFATWSQPALLVDYVRVRAL